MGYSDLSVVGSDMAADAAYEMIQAMTKTLKKELKQKSYNEFNTCGVVNVAMIFDELIIPNKYYAVFGGVDLIELAKLTAIKLKKLYDISNKADWGNTQDGKNNKKYHLNKYKRLLKRLNKFIAFSESW
jgi:hypothetical protein